MKCELYTVQCTLYSVQLYKTECKLGGHIMETFVELTPPAKDAQLGFFWKFDLTLRANNSTLKTARPKKYHIFGILGT